MKLSRGVSFFIIAVFFISMLSCGKKAPPVLPKKKEFKAHVKNLEGHWENKELYLTGEISGLKTTGNIAEEIKGCRLYYAQFSVDSPPCVGCPIKYNGYQEYGSEVISSGFFRCHIPLYVNETIFVYKVCLIGKDGVVGPCSESLLVKVINNQINMK